MSKRSRMKTVTAGIAMTAMLYGAAVLLLKSSVILPGINWLGALSAADLDAYLSMVARGSIAVGAITLLSVIIHTEKKRTPHQGDLADARQQRPHSVDHTEQ